MEALSPQYRWFSLVANRVMVVEVAPVLSEAHGPGEPSQIGGYLMTLARRMQMRKHGSTRRCSMSGIQGKDQKGQNLRDSREKLRKRSSYKRLQKEKAKGLPLALQVGRR
jgi:hypothetical protein